MKKNKKSLLQQLKWTILGLSTALISLWLLFYIYMNFAIKSYTMHNMEQVSESVITDLDNSFLELEDISFAMSENEVINDFLTTEDRLQFHAKSTKVKEELNRIAKRNMLAENLLLYNNKGEYYRFYGNVSNTSAKKIYYTIRKETDNKQIQLELNGLNYIGYVDSIHYKNAVPGKIVILIEENDINRMLQEAGGPENMTIGLAANDKIIAANDKKILDSEVDTLSNSTKYLLHKKVGFTSFELFIVYENANRNIYFIFMGSIIITAFLLWVIIEVFLHFWRNRFFQPIQGIIQEVEKFEGGKGDQLKGTDIEYFDGLVVGINDMLYRIEQKEAELFQTAFCLQESELKKQKALIISLKKQINAHFTVNILNIIKALSSEGDNEKAGLMCDGLSYLLRYANAGESPVTAMEEFFILNKYLTMMEIRYPGRFTAEVDMEDFLEDVRLPRMLIQPLVENCILHAFKEVDDNGNFVNTGTSCERVRGHIHIYCKEGQQELQFVVEDNGCGMREKQLIMLQEEIENVLSEDEALVEGLSHVALKNIQRRVLSYFGIGYGVTITSKFGEGTKVILNIPRM